MLVGVALRLGDPHGGDVHAGHLELGRGPGAQVLRSRIGPGELVGQHRRLLPQRSDQPVDLAAVLDAFPHREDVVVLDRTHVVVDDDGPFDGEAAGQGHVGVGPDAGGDDHEVALQVADVPEPNAGDLVGADHAGGAGPGEDRDAELLDAALEHVAAGCAELGVHEVAGRVHDGDVETESLQAPGRLEPEQSAADHDRLVVVLVFRVLDHGPRVVERAETEHARQENLS